MKNKKELGNFTGFLKVFLIALLFLFFISPAKFLEKVGAQDQDLQNIIQPPDMGENYNVEIMGLDENLPEINAETPLEASNIIAEPSPQMNMVTPQAEPMPLEPLPSSNVEQPISNVISPESLPAITNEEIQPLTGESQVPQPSESINVETPTVSPVETPTLQPQEQPGQPAPAATKQEKPRAAEEKPMPVTKVSLDFKEADIRNVLRILSYKSGVNIVASPEVTGLVTIRLTDVPWDKALEVILDTYGYGLERKEDIITVYPMATLTAKKKEQADLAEVQPTVTKVIKLKFVDAVDMKKALDPQLSPRGKITVLAITGQAGWEFGGAELGKRKRASEKQSRSKMLIISDIPPVLAKLEEVIAKLDILPVQVLIETRILEVNRDKLKDFGLELGTGASGDGFIETSSKDGFSPQGPETQMKLKSQTLQVAPSTFGPKAALGGTTATFAGGLTAYFQKVTGTQFQAILHALEEDVQTNTLSAPRILTLSNQEATILVGTKYPILTSEISSESASTVTTTLDYYQDIGIQLNVVPQVNEDGFINLIVHPAITSYTTTVGTNAYPIIDTRETETQILIKDGETVVIGGLLKDVKGTSEYGIPVLSRIPILGALFKRQNVDTQKVDLLIFITASVVKTEEDMITLMQNKESPVRSLVSEEGTKAQPVSKPEPTKSEPVELPKVEPAPKTE